MRVTEESSLLNLKKTNRFLCSLWATLWPVLNERKLPIITVRTMLEIIMNIAMAIITSTKVNPFRDALALCRLLIASNRIKTLFLITSSPYSAPDGHFRLPAVSQAPSQIALSPNQVLRYSSILLPDCNGIQRDWD